MSEQFKRSLKIVDGPDKFEIMLALFDNVVFVNNIQQEERTLGFSIKIDNNDDDIDIINVTVKYIYRHSNDHFIIGGSFYPQQQNPEIFGSIVSVDELNKNKDGDLEYDIVYNISNKTGHFKF